MWTFINTWTNHFEVRIKIRTRVSGWGEVILSTWSAYKRQNLCVCVSPGLALWFEAGQLIQGGGSREKNAEKKNERLMDRTFGRRPVSVESLCTVFEVDAVHSDSIRFVCCPVMLVSVALVLSCYMIIQGFPLKTQTWNTQKEDWSLLESLLIQSTVVVFT